MDDTAARIVALRQKITEADRQRAQAEAAVELHQRQLAEIDQQILALGVKPDKAEATLAKLEAQLAKDLDTLDTALAEETAAYRAILQAAR